MYLYSTSSLWQAIPSNSTSAAGKLRGAAAEDFLVKSCGRSPPQDGGHRGVEERKRPKQVHTSLPENLLAKEAGASEANLGNDFLLEVDLPSSCGAYAFHVQSPVFCSPSSPLVIALMICRVPPTGPEIVGDFAAASPCFSNGRCTIAGDDCARTGDSQD
jgi:hypothetical protein